MEIELLDSLYRRIAVVDTYHSFIWTERFSDKGDFELNVMPTLENRNRFIAEVRLVIKESYRVMVVKTVQDYVNDEGEHLLKVTGFSLEEILEQRLAMAALTDLTTDPQWILEGTPKEIATQMFHDICITGILSPDDVLAVIELNIFPPDTIPEPVGDIMYIVDPTTLYLAEKTLCDTYMMGFRLVRDHDTTLLYFDVYMGSDRTRQQSTLPAVIFSTSLENLHNTSKLTSTAPYKNVAYVVCPVGSEIVFADGVDPTVEGFERRVLLVKADDITDVVPADATAKMIQKGREELSKYRRFVALDGEVTTNSQYVYGVHYNLGDLVTQEDPDGTTAVMQVTEQIFVSDKEGDRRYPTLIINELITPGSWADVPADLEWFDLDADPDTWADQP
jgi:hypothetical protein